MTTLYDLPLSELSEYRPPLDEPADLDAFWAAALAEADELALDPEFRPHSTLLRTVEVFDASFTGSGGQRVSAWLVLPRARPARSPCVVQYLGYNLGRGLPHDFLTWSAFGYAHLVVDTRGQGGKSIPGSTADLMPAAPGPHVPGFLTLGILDPEQYFYRRVYVDAVRAVAAAKAHPEIDADRIVVTGGSQGGGITLAAAALAPGVAAAMPDVPFLCHFRRGAEIASDGPYRELVTWLAAHRHRAAEAFATLRYFDNAVLSARASAPALFSVALRDPVCPPSTVFAAYNRYGGPGEIRVWEWNEHEGGQSAQVAEQAAWLAKTLTP
ncbi:cephalosporin-C deacetylase [Amycolatopsis endophytica]|uniref:Cephalosporin-C deacetylase n=1 Tax=Amycolatopsis endophytica TaxID=860233 RepID=A0A853B4I5_9PSEU|nr:acetylxylan esterase [Amycolatopsis endophytica]NYI90113.1 cephalosporin-C deacetylase [Amycolatopsis endophytica]